MKIERMSGPDAAWLHMDRPENLMVVNTVLTFETTPDWAVVDAVLQQRLVDRYRRFRQRAVDPWITVGALAPIWQSVPTRARDHIVRVSLPAPGDARALHAYVGAQAGLPLDARRPLWEVHEIDGYGAGAALLLRTHHAIGDGRAMVEVISGLTQPCSVPCATLDRQRQRSGDDRARGAGPWVEASRKLSERLVRWPDLDRPRLTGCKTVVSSPPTALERVKQAARSNGSSVNDVVLAAVAGALRSTDAPPCGLRPSPARPAPPVFARGPCRDVEVIVPIDLRPPGPVSGELGNRFGLAFLRLPVASSDPDERLEQVTMRMRAIKQSREANLVFGGLGLAGLLPRPVQAAWTNAFIKDAAAVVTNVKGPAAPVSLAGSRVTGMCFWVPSTGSVGIGVSIVSYAGDLIVGLVVDDGVVADGVALAGAIERELERLTRVEPQTRTSGFEASQAAPA